MGRDYQEFGRRSEGIAYVASVIWSLLMINTAPFHDQPDAEAI